MVKELQEKRARLHEENTALLQRVSREGRDVMTPEETQEWDRRDAAIDELTKNIERRIRHEQIEATLAAAPEDRRTAAVPATGDHNGHGRGGSAAILRARATQQDLELALRGWFLMASPEGPQDEHRSAAQRASLNLNSKTITFNLQAKAPHSLAELRDLSTTVPADGGFTVPNETMRALEEALLWYGGMRQVATVIRTSTGADLPIPTSNDTTEEGEIIGENQSTNQQDVTFDQLVLHAFKYSSKRIHVSIELLQDSAINLPEFLGRALGTRIGRIQNRHYTVGVGTTQPFGIVTQAAASGVAAGITYDHLVDLEHSVDVAYRNQGASFMMHDLTLAAVKKLLDTNARPLWLPATAGIDSRIAGGTLLGYPVQINNDMGTPSSSHKAVVFGALSKYQIRDVTSVTLLRLDELYAEKHQVAFVAFARSDGALLDAGTHPVKYLSVS